MMSSLFDDLKQGLEEAIAYKKGLGEARENVYPTGTAFRLLDVLASDDIEITDYVVEK